MNKDYWLYGLAVLVGIIVWIAVSTVSGRREAWDSGSYFRIGLPVVCVASAALGFLEPSRPWRWGVAPPHWPVLLDALDPGTGQPFASGPDDVRHALRPLDHHGKDRRLPWRKKRGQAELARV